MKKKFCDNVFDVYLKGLDVEWEEVKEVAEMENDELGYKIYKVKCLEGIFGEVMVDGNMDLDHLEVVMSCFQDHFDNVGDQFTNIWGGHELSNGNYVDGYYMQYKGQNALLQIHYITRDKIHDEFPNVKLEVEGA